MTREQAKKILMEKYEIHIPIGHSRVYKFYSKEHSTSIEFMRNGSVEVSAKWETFRPEQLEAIFTINKSIIKEGR